MYRLLRKLVADLKESHSKLVDCLLKLVSWIISTRGLLSFMSVLLVISLAFVVFFERVTASQVGSLA